MITINGKVFRNLEEQVAYLSEMIPLFSFRDGKLVIKQGDGTLIVRLEVNDIKDISVNTINDIATLTMTYNDGTTTTQTIDMTSYLKKNTTTTTKEQAYIKNPDGTQSIKTIDDQASNGTLVLRTSTGRINSVDPQYDGNVATKKYVDDSIAGIHLYQHRIEMTYSGENEEKVCFIVYNNTNEAIDINDIDYYVVGNFYRYDDVNVPFNYIYVDSGELHIEDISGDYLNTENWLIANLGEELYYHDFITQIL